REDQDKIIGNCTLQGFNGHVVASRILIETRFGGGQPIPFFLFRGSLQFTDSEFHQSAVLQQLRLLHAQVVARSFLFRHLGITFNWRDAIEQRVLWRIVLLFDLSKAYTRQFAVVVILEAPGEFLIIGASHPRIVVFFRQASTPVERGWDFRGSRIERNLLLKSILSFSVLALA